MRNGSSQAASASEKCQLCSQVSDSLGQGPLISLPYPSEYSPPPESCPYQLFPAPARVFFHSWDSPQDSDRNRLQIQTRSYSLVQPLKVSGECELQPSLIPDNVERGDMRREDESIEDNTRPHLQAHYQCAAWSSGEAEVCSRSSSTWKAPFLSAVSTAASQLCDFCNQNGAGIRCSAPDCASHYHFPCALMEGASMDFQCFQLFCPKHSELSQSCCLVCNEKGGPDCRLLYCYKCGRSWHPKCLSLNDTTNLRAGWSCQACKVCQKCNDREDISQLLVCSSCDKAIHLGCAGLVAMPSSEWRCEECRCCIDCGSKSAGNGPSCRWHGGYTICSRCNQLRFKGFFCFICQGAYKQVTDIPMIQCDYCQRWIHAKCDKINRDTYDMLGRPKSRYFCPECRETKGVNIFLAHEEASDSSPRLPIETSESTEAVAVVDDCTVGKTELDEIILVPDTIVLQEGLDLVTGASDGGIGDSLLGVGSELNVYEEEVDDKNLDKLDKSIELQTQEEFEADLKLHSGQSLFYKDSVGKRLKKREILESYTPGVSISKERRPLPSSRLNLKRITVKNKKKNRLRNLLTSQLGLPKGALNNRFRNHFKENRRKFYRGKELNGKSALEIDHIPSFRLLVFPYMSRYLLYQKDLCACCGAGGQGKDGSLLVCAQCANCYHDYCLKTKVPSSRLRHGWRCPKCASCEGCSLATDEACLLMCDQCDILYHTYCLKPPLRSVPKGPWKCSWCVKCTQCASDSPGINGTWQKDFSLCAPCGSRSSCHICSVNYLDGDLIMKCSLCKRWSHGSCDGFNSKSDIQKMVQKKYYCSLCRPLIREKGLKNLLPYKQYVGHKKETYPFKKLRRMRRGEQALDPNPSSQNSSFIDTGPADLSSSIDQTVIEDMNLLSSMNKNYASGITLEHNATATIIQQPRDLLKSHEAPRDRKLKVPVGLISKKKSLKAMREESRKQRKHERRLKSRRSTTEEDDNELDSFDKNILPHLTRYQKACLRWVMDEERGTLATKAPVLYANMSFTDLKDKYPGWMDRARAVNNLWKKLPMVERQQYIDKAKLNREKLESEGVYQKRNPPRIIRLYAVKAFKLNQMTDQPQGLKRDFSTRRPRRTVAELQKAREEEDKVKKEIGMEDNKPRRKGRRIITTKKSSCFSSSKNRNGMHPTHSNFSYHGDMHPDLMFCSPIPDDKSPLHEHHFSFVHQPFQPLLHGTKGSGEHKSHHSTPSASDVSVSKLTPALPFGTSTTSPNHQASRNDLSSNCVPSPQPFNLPRPNSLDIQPHGHAVSQSTLEFPEIKPFKAPTSPYPQPSTGSSRHILHSGYPVQQQQQQQQGYKSGSYPHSAPVQSYPHSPFQHHPGNSSMCFPQTPHGYNYQMHPNAPHYQGPMPYYYSHPHDSKFRPYSEQKPLMPSQHHLTSRNQAPINLDSGAPDKQDLSTGLEFSLNQETRSSCPAPGDGALPSCTNGLSASDNRNQVATELETTLADTSERPNTSSSTPDKTRLHGKPPIQPHTPLHSKYKHDVTASYHTPKYSSPWSPVTPAFADNLTSGDEFKKPQTPSEAGMRSVSNRKKGSIGMPPEFPSYGYPYNQQEPMGYQPPYFPSDMPYQPGPPSSPYNMQMLSHFPQDPAQHAKYKSNRRHSNPLEYSPTCPSRSTPKQIQRPGPPPSPFNPSPADSTRQTPFPSFPHPPPSSQHSPLPNSPTGSRSHSLSEIPPFPKPNQKFSTVVLPSPSLDRASTSHCLKTRDHPDLMEHLEKITSSCNKRELSYFDCLELTNMTAAHTHLIDSLSTDTKSRYSLYEELNSILEVRRSSILRRYSTKPVRLKKQYLTKVLVEPVVPLEILIPSLSFLWSSPDKLSSSSADLYSSFPSFSSHSDTPPPPPPPPIAPPRPVPATSSEVITSDTDLQNRPDLAVNVSTPPDATSTPLTSHTSATNSSLTHTLPTSSNCEEPLPNLVPSSSSLKHDSSFSDLNLSDCSPIPSDPESVSNITESNSDRKRHKSPELDSADSKKCRSSPLVSDNNSSMSLLDLGVGESASFSDQFQSLVQEMYGEATQFTLDNKNVSGMDIPLSLDQAIKEEMDSDKQESEQPNTVLLFKKKPRQTRATKWAVWSPDFYKAFLKSAASRKCRRHKMMPQLLSTRSFSYPDPDDERVCILCAELSDQESKRQGRLVAAGVDEWVHTACVLWSDGVQLAKDGLLENASQIIEKSVNNICANCNKNKATVMCFSCSKYFHLPCASLTNCHFYSDKSVECAEHYTGADGEVGNFFTSDFFYIQFCNAVMLDSVSASEGKLMLRVGNVIFLKIGQLCPKVKGTYTEACIYPVGYVCSRFYWSVNDPFQLSQYWCSITLEDSLPLFSVYTIDRTQDPPRKLCIADKSIMVVWEKILEPIQNLRATHGQIAINKKTMKPEDFFGLSEPTIVQMIESLPGIEQMVGYSCKYPVRKPTHSLPIPYNPSGSARTEIVPKAPQYRRHLIHQVASPSETVSTQVATLLTPNKDPNKESPVTPVHITPVLSKNAQYRKLRSEWKNNVRLAKSNIQGLGLFARRDIDKDQMVIEYIGEMIKNELADVREQTYNRQNRGCYMFRVDIFNVVDATRKGGFARYINHSCEPNCTAEIVNIEGKKKILIFSQQKILTGEELTYDYKFEFEDTAYKIPCLCGSSNCRKWMN